MLTEIALFGILSFSAFHRRYLEARCQGLYVSTNALSFIFAFDSDQVFIGSTLFWSITIRSIVVWLTEVAKAAAKQQKWGRFHAPPKRSLHSPLEGLVRRRLSRRRIAATCRPHHRQEGLQDR